MKVLMLLLSLLLYLAGLKQVVARFIPRSIYEPINWWTDDGFDNFNSPAHYYSDTDFDKLTKDDSFEEPKLTVDSGMNEEVDFLDALLSSLLTDEESVTSLPEKNEHFKQDISSEIDDSQNNKNSNNNKVEDDNHDDDEEAISRPSDEAKTIQFDILLYNPSETKSSEEKTQRNNEQADKSSEENFTSLIAEENGSDESRGSETQTSDETKVEDNSDVSEQEIKELTSLLLTLSAMDGIIQISNKYADVAGWQPHDDDDELQTKEVDTFGSVFDGILKELFVAKDNENVTGGEADDRNYSLGTQENDSKEEADTPSPNTESSVSTENDINLVSYEFHGIEGGDGDKPENLNEHKYDIIDATSAFRPTTAPYIPEMADTTNSDNDKVIQEYVEIREDLDNQQDSLQKNKYVLDKDFYAIISNDNDGESMNKFGKDIYQVYESLDRLKRNLDTMQNLKSKVYFHQLLTAALKEVQSKSTHS